MPLIGLTTGWFWQNIVGRLLLGGVPGTDLVYRLSAEEGTRRDLESVVSLMSPASQLKPLAMPELIGAVAVSSSSPSACKRAGDSIPIHLEAPPMRSLLACSALLLLLSALAADAPNCKFTAARTLKLDGRCQGGGAGGEPA
jgi:hypothetical protein